MKAFEQPIPQNPKEAGKNYKVDKEKIALEKQQEENQKEKDIAEAAFTVFDRPLDPEQKREKGTLERKLMLLSGVLKNKEKIQAELDLKPEEIKDRTTQKRQLDQLEELELQLLKSINPDELENYTDKKTE